MKYFGKIVHLNCIYYDILLLYLKHLSQKLCIHGKC